MQEGDWSIKRTYSTFLISHHINPAYTLVYSNGKNYRYLLFADKDRAGKYDFNTEKHDSYTENMILKYLKYCLQVSAKCIEMRIAYSKGR